MTYGLTNETDRLLISVSFRDQSADWSWESPVYRNRDVPFEIAASPTAPRNDTEDETIPIYPKL